MASAANSVATYPQTAQMQVRRYPLRDGDAGIARTVQWMSAVVRGKEGATHPAVRAAALDIVRGLGSRNKQGQIPAVLDWVKQNIDFRGSTKSCCNRRW